MCRIGFQQGQPGPGRSSIIASTVPGQSWQGFVLADVDKIKLFDRAKKNFQGPPASNDRLGLLPRALQSGLTARVAPWGSMSCTPKLTRLKKPTSLKHPHGRPVRPPADYFDAVSHPHRRSCRVEMLA